MTYTSEFDRMVEYSPIMDGARRIAFYPEVKGFGHNEFEYADRNRTYFKLKNSITGEECIVPYAAIEFVTPSNIGAIIIRLIRTITYEHGTLL